MVCVLVTLTLPRVKPQRTLMSLLMKSIFAQRRLTYMAKRKPRYRSKSSTGCLHRKMVATLSSQGKTWFAAVVVAAATAVVVVGGVVVDSGGGLVAGGLICFDCYYSIRHVVVDNLHSLIPVLVYHFVWLWKKDISFWMVYMKNSTKPSTEAELATWMAVQTFLQTVRYR